MSLGLKPNFLCQRYRNKCREKKYLAERRPFQGTFPTEVHKFLIGELSVSLITKYCIHETIPNVLQKRLFSAGVSFHGACLALTFGFQPPKHGVYCIYIYESDIFKCVSNHSILYLWDNTKNPRKEPIPDEYFFSRRIFRC